jgi:hypothetical protein
MWWTASAPEGIAKCFRNPGHLRSMRSGCPFRTSFPDFTGIGAAGVHLGPRALALAADLNKAKGLSMRKTCAVLRDSELRQAPALHGDETSWWVGGCGFLLPSCSPSMSLLRAADVTCLTTFSEKTSAAPGAPWLPSGRSPSWLSVLLQCHGRSQTRSALYNDPAHDWILSAA